MVDFTLIPIINGKTYDVIKCEGYSGCSKHFLSAKKNLNLFSMENRPTAAIIPDRCLSKLEKEEYRAYFCKKAKEDQRNYIYFEDKVTIVEVDQFKGTMFEDL